jgi:diacylglycerol O-acyltransferase
MERLSGLDSAFLHAETAANHLHIVAVVVLDPSTAPHGFTVDDLRDLIRARLHLIPPFRRRLLFVPMGINNPLWVEDPDLDLEFHVRRATLPAPGTEHELATLTGDIAGRPLNRQHPLWQMTYVEGLEDGHVAVIAKIHHAAIDGASGVEIIASLFDLEVKPIEEPPDVRWKPERIPGDGEVLFRSALSLVKNPMKLARAMRDTTTAAVRVFRHLSNAESHTAASPLNAPKTSLNAAITPHRRVAFSSVSFSEVKTIKYAFGVTINDVVLAIATGALRRWFAARGELPDKPLVAAVPVNVRIEGDASMRNVISTLFASLPVEIADPQARLEAVSSATKDAKHVHELVGGGTLGALADTVAPALLSAAVRVFSDSKVMDRMRPVINMIVSNVPGPSFPVYLGGARMVAIYPLGPIFDGSGLNLTVISYLDEVGFGFLACRETVPELDELAAHVPAALQELLKAADELAGDAAPEETRPPKLSGS